MLYYHDYSSIQIATYLQLVKSPFNIPSITSNYGWNPYPMLFFQYFEFIQEVPQV